MKKISICCTLLTMMICMAVLTLTSCGENSSSPAQAPSVSDTRKQAAEPEPLTADKVKLMLENNETIDDGEFAAPINLPTPSNELSIPHSGDWASLDDSICTVSDGDIITGRSIGDTCLWSVDHQNNVHTVKIKVRKAAYITIDDWPDFQVTYKILETLEENNVKATFFLNASDYYKSVYPAIKNAGHTIANHSYSHASSSMYKSEEALLSQFSRMNDFLDETIGVRTNIIRLPGGSCSKHIGNKRYSHLKALKENGYHVFDWTATFGDSSPTATAEKSIRWVTDDCDSDFEIILMHHKKTSLKALPTVIENLRAKDYEFFPITDSTPSYTF